MALAPWRHWRIRRLLGGAISIGFLVPQCVYGLARDYFKRHAKPPNGGNRGFLAFDRLAGEMAIDQFSQLRAQYAALHKCSPRTAQRHAQNEHPKWKKFLESAAVGNASPAMPPQLEVEDLPLMQAGATPPDESAPENVVPFYREPDGALHPMQLLEKRAWQVHSETFSKWQTLKAGKTNGEISAAIAYAKEIPKLRDDFEKARKMREAWEVSQRFLITIEEFNVFHNEFIKPLAEMLRGLPFELPSLVNPNDAAFARRQLNDWLRDKVQPQVQAMLEGTEKFKAA